VRAAGGWLGKKGILEFFIAISNAIPKFLLVNNKDSRENDSGISIYNY